MENQTSQSNKPETIFYRLNFKSSLYSQDLIEYLQEQRHCLNGRQKVEQIVETFLLPLVVSPEDPNFKAIVVYSAIVPISLYSHRQVASMVGLISLKPLMLPKLPVLNRLANGYTRICWMVLVAICSMPRQ